jgi:hypothetical protein
MTFEQFRNRIPTAKCLALASIVLLSCLSVNTSFSQETVAGTGTRRQIRRRGPTGSQLVEQFSFLIKDFKMDHQAQMNNLNISVQYRYVTNISNAEYPDFRLIEKDIETFLNNYPNETDYWEILNKKMTSMVIKKYRSLTSVTADIEVLPSSVVPFLRSSTVTRSRPSMPVRGRGPQ